ncbi:uncharacterized protein BDZ99DRAFT_514333 [Mytilinidion resinicola]|uniref:Major facilitator superfamily (MFS) profile domain-containing protein n=1 Tax=Mytilinidion resinicola TaxID=574789 RepID=A0A6A6Z4V0_9PEZI|nr:uncharacterized protein BDZ99DRAFT_514333 [Mytilinidion resinicola]KAF2815683.1 hypothetical protein BDZ99DRAFT_514333 [Mytilinidion resinicola]
MTTSDNVEKTISQTEYIDQISVHKPVEHVAVHTDTFDISEDALGTNDIGPSSNLLWVPLAYTLSLSVSFLLVGRFSDIFARRWFFIIGNAFAIIGTIMGATAKTVNTIVGGNVFNGLGAAI